MGSFKKVLCFSSIIAISACGGGGGGGSSNEGGSGGSGGSSSGSTNSAPEFVSASEVTTEENSTGTLLTLSASDANGDSISYNTIGGEDQSRFLIDNGNQLRFGFAPDFENPADADGDNIYQVTIEASDGNGGQTSQEIVVTVTNVNDGAPEFSSATEVTVEEDVSGVFYTAMAQDPDGDEVTFSLSGDADTALFSIDSASGELSFNTAPDFESPADSDEDNLYQLSLNVADSEGFSSQFSLQVAVTNLPTPSARIIFPTGGANMGGELSNIALSTRVLDLESGESASEHLVSIAIDGQSPAEDITSPSVWYLDSPINEGSETYTLSAQFVTGETIVDSLFVKNEQLISIPVSVSYDNLHGNWYFADGGRDTIFEVGTDGSRRVVSGPLVGSGPVLNPIDMEKNFPEVRTDPADDFFVVLNYDGSIYSVQRDTGDRTQLTTWPQPIPEISTGFKRLTLTSSGGEAYAARTVETFGSIDTYGEIIKFDLSSGDHSVISSSSSASPVGTGPNMLSSFGIALDEANGQLYVGDLVSGSIFRVNIASGDRTIISGDSVGSGESAFPSDLIVDLDSDQIYVTGGENVLQVDIETGNRSVVTSGTKGEGLQLDYAAAIGRGADSDHLVVSGRAVDPVIMSVEISTGDRSIVSSNKVGMGPSYKWHDVNYILSTDQLLVISEGGGSAPGEGGSVAAEIDLQNGNRAIVYHFAPNDSPRIVASTIVPGESDGHAYIFDEYSDRLLKIDLVNKGSEVISAADIGEGPEFYGLVAAMELDATNNRMILLQRSGLMSVDLENGDREIIFDNHTGSAPYFDSVDGLALDLANNRALVSDSGKGGIWQVDLTTGDRRAFASSVHGGSNTQVPTDVVLDTIGNQLLVGTESGNLVAIDLDSFSQSTLTSGRNCDTDCRGGGIAVSSLDSLAVDAEGRRLFAYDNGMFGIKGVVVIDLRSGQRALASK
ncbi:Ig-like domain-containing protein [Microbulbifer sp. ZKSA004]|uniref:Ig-like domain-containing protein n=1 Tax=Microbulbifer sp. ZKSA004 TaxID=3243389 RepID=UPI00403A4E82